MAVQATDHENLVRRYLDWRKVTLVSIGVGLVVGMLILLVTPFIQWGQQPKVFMPTNPADPRPEPLQPKKFPSKPEEEKRGWFHA